MGNRNNDPELPGIFHQLRESHQVIEEIGKRLFKGQFLLARERLTELSNRLTIVATYTESSIKEGLTFEEVPEGAKIERRLKDEKNSILYTRK